MSNAVARIAQMLADGINPALLLSILSELPVALSSAESDRALRLRRAVRFAVAGCVAVAVPVVLAELGKRYEVWGGHPGFPSGHTTFAASASAVIVAYRGNYWLIVAVPLTVLMMASLVYLRHHNIPEVLGGLVLGAGLGAILMRALSPPTATASGTPPD
ncbi:MAG: phosphatase PAP2 family protein [Armatimonadetes bacterium]|nr:phosphatase PAP2 family protein [Armatimonadota bacterium]